jgi:environmental stress-induced protein Ves
MEIPGQEGILSLLEGEKMVIKPEGFDQVRLRGGQQHRLRQDANKWKALGIGDDEEQPPA